MSIVIHRKFIFTVVFFFLFISQAHAWTAGQKSVWPAVELTGGGDALDGISGVSIHSHDLAITSSPTMNTVYFYKVRVTGNTSGTTTESSPYWIMPNTAGSGNTLAGVSMWQLTGISGDTGFFRSLEIDGRSITGVTVDAWSTAYGWGDFHSPLAIYTSQAQLHGVSGYAFDSQVSGFVISQDQGVLSQVTNSQYAKQTGLAAAGAPGTTSGTSLAQKYALDSYLVAGAIAGVSLPNSGASPFTGAYLSNNLNACAIAVSFSTAGDSTFVVAPWNFAVSGVSLINASGPVGTAGASIFQHDVPTASYNVSGSGATTYNVAATGRILAGTPLLFKVGTIPAGQTWTEQLFGRKE